MSGSYCVAPGAQWLQVLSIMIANRKRNGMVHQDGRRDPASFGTVAAQRLLGEDRVVDAAQGFVVAAQGGERAVVWLVGMVLRAGEGADAGAHCTWTAVVAGSGRRG